MLRAQFCYRTFSTFWVFSHKSNATTYPTIPIFSFPSIRSSSIRLHFTVKLRPISCYSIHNGSFDPQFNKDDDKDLQFLETSLLVSVLITLLMLGEFAFEKLIASFWGDDNGECPDQFHLVKNVVEKLGYEVW
ncbi:hypothetical protein PVK06_004767 [Gossypium arboreum]|uniref:Uncharacterized protein n=1 Tax=Gossypium arboreum TaxID=29729 RepID=A0ABR0QTC0_GOSAR|nr:hypothetical protein PVK06_004767 [Gossypium arboreum]